MEFPKKYDSKEQEPSIQKFWDDENIFKFDFQSNKPIYSIDTPPPYASSDHLHVGHAMHYSQFEFVARYKRMRGYNVYFPMGFDDNGLPTERYVEKKYKINKSKISKPEFIKLCLEETERVGVLYKAMWKRVGLSVDWSLLYQTISPYAQKISQRSFIDLYNKNVLVRRKDPIMWCPKCSTAVAQADLEDLEKKSKFTDIAFKSSEDGSELIISTTRPELIPACVALFVNPNDDRYKYLIGKKAKVPLFDYEVPILSDDSVEIDKGTGLMMVCSWGDVEDVEKWKKYDLDTRLIISEYGHLNKLAGPYEGLNLNEAREKILSDLEENNLIKNQKEITHTTNVHERCNTPIEFFNTHQWFIHILDKKTELLSQVDKINWYPQHMKTRCTHWIENLKWDWCISRQRYYGVPFPVWYCSKCNKIKLPEDNQLPVDPTLTQPSGSCDCGSTEFTPETDIMDTWMTSSMTPQIALRWKEEDSLMNNFPESLRPQGHDIIRTWAFYTIVKSYLHHNKIPWKDIMISGHGQDANGRKMSKSLGNVVSVPDILDKYSADALRFWAASVSLGEDLPFQEKEVLSGQKTITKLWNASKFSIMHLEDFDYKKPKLEVMDQYFLSKAHSIVKKATTHFEKYEYSKTKSLIENFFWNMFCDQYLEISKDRLYNPDRRGIESRKSAQYTLHHTLLICLKILAPIMPHVTESIYQQYYLSSEKSKSIHLSQWPEAEDSLINPMTEKLGDFVLDVISTVRRIKSLDQVSLKKEVSELIINCSDDEREYIKLAKDDILAVTNSKEIVFDGKATFECSKSNCKICVKYSE